MHQFRRSLIRLPRVNMNRLLVASSFEQQLRQLQMSRPVAILLHGEDGIGLSHIAKHIAPIIETEISPHTTKGEIDEKKGSISIDAIRLLYEQTRRASKREHVVLINHADTMGHSAQNALLKLLEEPPRNVSFILTANTPDLLLPTIRSRLASYHIPRTSSKQSQQLLDGFSHLSRDQKRQLFFAASGRPALLTQLANQPEMLQNYISMMSSAKQFVSSRNAYERLITVLPYTSNRADLLQFIDGCIQILKHLNEQTPTSDYMVSLDHYVDFSEQLTMNANTKLTAMKLVLQ